MHDISSNTNDASCYAEKYSWVIAISIVIRSVTLALIYPSKNKRSFLKRLREKNAHINKWLTNHIEFNTFS